MVRMNTHFDAFLHPTISTNRLASFIFCWIFNLTDHVMVRIIQFVSSIVDTEILCTFCANNDLVRACLGGGK